LNETQYRNRYHGAATMFKLETPYVVCYKDGGATIVCCAACNGAALFVGANT